MFLTLSRHWRMSSSMNFVSPIFSYPTASHSLQSSTSQTKVMKRPGRYESVLDISAMRLTSGSIRLVYVFGSWWYVFNLFFFFLCLASLELIQSWRKWSSWILWANCAPRMPWLRMDWRQGWKLPRSLLLPPPLLLPHLLLVPLHHLLPHLLLPLLLSLHLLNRVLTLPRLLLFPPLSPRHQCLLHKCF